MGVLQFQCPASAPKGHYPLLNADINGLHLVQISGLWVLSYYYTITALPAIQTVAHCSRLLQPAAQSDHNNIQVHTHARAHARTHTYIHTQKQDLHNMETVFFIYGGMWLSKVVLL